MNLSNVKYVFTFALGELALHFNQVTFHLSYMYPQKNLPIRSHGKPINKNIQEKGKLSCDHNL